MTGWLIRERVRPLTGWPSRSPWSRARLPLSITCPFHDTAIMKLVYTLLTTLCLGWLTTTHASTHSSHTSEQLYSQLRQSLNFWHADAISKPTRNSRLLDTLIWPVSEPVAVADSVAQLFQLFQAAKADPKKLPVELAYETEWDGRVRGWLIAGVPKSARDAKWRFIAKIGRRHFTATVSVAQ